MSVDQKETTGDLDLNIRKADSISKIEITTINHNGEDLSSKVKSGKSTSLWLAKATRKHEVVTGIHSQPPLCSTGPSNETELATRLILQADMTTLYRIMSSENEQQVNKSEAEFRDGTFKEEERSRIDWDQWRVTPTELDREDHSEGQVMEETLCNTRRVALAKHDRRVIRLRRTAGQLRKQDLDEQANLDVIQARQS